MSAWGSLALWFALPAAETLRAAMAAGFMILGAGCLLRALLRRRIVRPLVPLMVAFVALLAWWTTIKPSNDRAWQDDVAVLPSAVIDGDRITLRNTRNFDYRGETDFTPRWQDKVVDLRDLDSLDLIAVYWMGDAIAHTILSFGFKGEQVAISIEIRKEEGEAFSALAGFFRRYELYYVVAEERDVIGLRTTHREPPEDVYLYRVTMPPENLRGLFLAYLDKINALNVDPEFYNTATTNCTTNIITHLQAFRGPVPLSWKMLASGYFPEMVYERGALDQSLPYEDLRRLSLINARALAVAADENFSRRIREGLPGMP